MQESSCSASHIPQQIVSDEEYDLLTAALATAECQTNFKTTTSTTLPSSSSSCSAPIAISCYVSTIPSRLKSNFRYKQPPLLLVIQPRPRFPSDVLSDLVPHSLEHNKERHHSPYSKFHFEVHSYTTIQRIFEKHHIEFDFPQSLAKSIISLHKYQNESCEHDDMMRILPSSLWNKLLPFQQTGVVHAITNLNGRILIADDMGLGKTVQALAISEFYRLKYIQDKTSPENSNPIIIICPAMLCVSWYNAIKQFVPNTSSNSISIIQTLQQFQTSLLSPSMKPRDEWDSPNVISHIICSYDFLGRIMMNHDQPYQKLSSNIVIVDECHLLRNLNTQRSKCTIPFILSATIRILVSGTPLLSNPLDIYSILICLLHQQDTPFLSKPSFVGRYLKDIQLSRRSVSYCHELNRILSMVMIRRSKAEIQMNLPPKHRIRVIINFSAERLQNINNMYEKIKRFDEEDDKSKPMPNELTKYKESLYSMMYTLTADLKLGAIITRLNQIILHSTEPNSNHKRGKKILVFAHHQKVLDTVDSYLTCKNIQFVRIDGTISTSKRNRLVDEFQSPEHNIQVAVLSFNVASTGITLTAADTVLFAELSWVPATLSQAEDRAHRIGRAGPVYIEYIIVPGSLDDAMMSAIDGKAGMVFKMIDKSNNQGHVNKDENDNNLNNFGNHSTSAAVTSDDSSYAPDPVIEISEDCIQQVLSDYLTDSTSQEPTQNSSQMVTNIWSTEG